MLDATLLHRRLPSRILPHDLRHGIEFFLDHGGLDARDGRLRDEAKAYVSAGVAEPEPRASAVLAEQVHLHGFLWQSRAAVGA
jgi:hypothetical protein